MQIFAPTIKSNKEKTRCFHLWAVPSLLDEFLAIAKESGTTGTWLLTKCMKDYVREHNDFTREN
jgi:hypothetical protein